MDVVAAKRAENILVQAWSDEMVWRGVGVVGAVVLLLATLIVWRLLRRGRGTGAGGAAASGRQRPVALLGLPNAGKTALFLHLRDGTASDTHMSQRPNETVTLAQFPQGVRLIDYPGHQRVRDTWLQLVPSMAKASLVFVVNAVDLPAEAPQVAECVPLSLAS